MYQGSLTFQELIDLLDIVEDRVQADGTGGLASLDQSLELSHGPVRPQELGGNEKHRDPASIDGVARDLAREGALEEDGSGSRVSHSLHDLVV